MNRNPNETLTDYVLRCLSQGQTEPFTEQQRADDKRRLADLERSAGCYDDDCNDN